VFLHCLVDYPLQKPALEVAFFTLLGVVARRKAAGSPPRGISNTFLPGLANTKLKSLLTL